MNMNLTLISALTNKQRMHKCRGKDKLLHWEQEKENGSQNDCDVVELGRQNVDKVAEKVECGKEGEEYQLALALQNFFEGGFGFAR
jgi:hypothetical protein